MHCFIYFYFVGYSVDYVSDAGVKVSFVFCIIAAWLYLYYFLMGFDSTGPFVLTIYRIVSRDVPFFVTFYLIVLVAFGCAMSLLTNTGDMTVGYGFKHLILTIYDLIQVTVMMQQLGSYGAEIDVNFVPSNLVWVYNIIFTAFYIVVVLMFLNLLIAMINSTYGKLIEYDDALLLIEKYNIMSAMQNSLWLNEKRMRELPQSYAVRVDDYVTAQVMANGINNYDYDDNNSSLSQLQFLHSNKQSKVNHNSVGLNPSEVYRNSSYYNDTNTQNNIISDNDNNFNNRNNNNNNNNNKSNRYNNNTNHNNKLSNTTTTNTNTNTNNNTNTNTNTNNNTHTNTNNNTHTNTNANDGKNIYTRDSINDHFDDSKDTNFRQVVDIFLDDNLPTHYAFEMLDEDKTWWDSTITGKKY